jgi:hypothetical protein
MVELEVGDWVQVRNDGRTLGLLDRNRPSRSSLHSCRCYDPEEFR